MNADSTVAAHLTVRNVPVEVARALRKEMARRGQSLNQTVVDLLRVALGVTAETPAPNGLEKLAGAWSEPEHQRFAKATACFEKIDRDLWK